MDRRSFIRFLSSSTLMMSLGIHSKEKKMRIRMPTLFFGHGSPMNAIALNTFTSSLKKIGRSLEPPKAILIISAHWETQGTWLTNINSPKTIHDFSGFPKALYDIQYPAKGDLNLAKNIQNNITDPKVLLDERWGLDHGSWSILRHLFPLAQIPVIQLSLDRTQSFQYHFDLGRKLKFLRDEGVLIIGSGNITHNLRSITWKEDAPIMDWAQEFDGWVKEMAIKRDFKSLIDSPLKSKAGQLSIPTPEHYLPLLYILGASDSNDNLNFDIEEFQNGSISMRSFRFNS